MIYTHSNMIHYSHYLEYSFQLSQVFHVTRVIHWLITSGVEGGYNLIFIEFLQYKFILILDKFLAIYIHFYELWDLN